MDRQSIQQWVLLTVQLLQGKLVQLTEEGVPRAPLLCIADTAEPAFTLPCEDIIAAAGEPLATPEDLKPRLPGLTFLDDIFFNLEETSIEK